MPAAAPPILQDKPALRDLEPQAVTTLQRLRGDLPYFCEHVLRIRTKSGAVVPFKLNRAQLHLHDQVERMEKRTGRVRAVIVKGRQVGASTYLQARFYWKLWKSRRALRAFILTHEQPATDNLFGMAQRFHDLHDASLAKPPLKRGNAKEILFEDNDCGYQVATAGTKERGRSATFQLFHGSEVAFWPDADTHVTASFQAVGNVDGTELVLESTANGIGNLFYRLAQAAIRGQSDFEAIFIPWFWDDGYATECPDGWEPSKEWMEYAVAHGLTWEQLYWAYNKNRDLANSISAPLDKPCWKFMQEFPATFDEAFQSSGNSFIPAADVLRARRPENEILGAGPVILGVDPARSGDKVGIIDRQGRRMGRLIAMRMDPGGSSTYVASQVAAIIDRIKPDIVNIDVGSNGGPVYDMLMDWGYGHLLNPVNFGSNPVGTGPTGDDLYFNRRAEMYDGMRQWFAQEAGVQCPDDDAFQGDVCAATWGPGATRYNTSNELILEEKDAIKERLGASPDLGDAGALTFAVTVVQASPGHQNPVGRRKSLRRTGY